MAPGLRLDKDTIRLYMADMDYKTAPAVIAAMHRVADHGTYGYTTATAAPEYKPAIIGWYQRRHGVTIKPEWILHANGALDGVKQTIIAFSEAGDGVILCRPIYTNFTETIERLGRRVVNCQMIDEGNGAYRFDWNQLELFCAQPENKVFVLCSPQNPVGRVWKREELAKVAEFCRRNGVIVVSDEIHSDLVRKGIRHIPIIAAAQDLSNVIMVSGVNKTFNLMGLHCAYAVIPDEKLRAAYRKGYKTSMPTPFAIAGMIAAYNESEDWVDALNEYLDDTLRTAVAYMNEKLPKVRAYVPEGSYILWLDFNAYGYDDATLLYIISQMANVAPQDGLTHDPEHGQGFIRFCVTCSKATLLQAIDRIAAAFAQYEDRHKDRE